MKANSGVGLARRAWTPQGGLSPQSRWVESPPGGCRDKFTGERKHGLCCVCWNALSPLHFKKTGIYPNEKLPFTVLWTCVSPTRPLLQRISGHLLALKAVLAISISFSVENSLPVPLLCLLKYSRVFCSSRLCPQTITLQTSQVFEENVIKLQARESKALTDRVLIPCQDTSKHAPRGLAISRDPEPQPPHHSKDQEAGIRDFSSCNVPELLSSFVILLFPQKVIGPVDIIRLCPFRSWGWVYLCRILDTKWPLLPFVHLFLKPNSHLVLFSKTWVPVLCLLTLLLLTVQVSCLDPEWLQEGETTFLLPVLPLNPSGKGPEDRLFSKFLFPIQQVCPSGSGTPGCPWSFT